MILERDVENRLIKEIKDRGGLCWKFTSPGRKGVPDRMCAVKGNLFFVELKRPDAKARPDEAIQNIRKMQLEGQGQRVFKISSFEQVERLMRWVDEL